MEATVYQTMRRKLKLGRRGGRVSSLGSGEFKILFEGAFRGRVHHDNVLRDRGLLGQGRREDSSEGSESDKMPSSRPASRRHGLLWLTAMQDLSQLLPKDQPIPIGRKRTARRSADVALAGSTSNPVAESSEARRSFEFTQLQRINRAVADG